MKKEHFNGEELLCPIKYCMDIIGGKWKTSILCILADGKAHRTCNIKRKLGNITNTMLAQTLRQLSDANMIQRIQFNEVPPRVEYLLTENGKTVIPLLLSIAKWGNSQLSQEDIILFCKECTDIT